MSRRFAARSSEGVAVNFLIQNGFDIRKDREAEFQPWLADNEAGIAEACPEGVEYVGTFANIFGDDDHVGAYRSVWLMDSYAAMDRFSAAIKEGGTFALLMNELGRFAMDRQDGGSQSADLSRRVTDAAIWGIE
jgi:hypothetical protein